jgi:hypothetical protein
LPDGNARLATEGVTDPVGHGETSLLSAVSARCGKRGDYTLMRKKDGRKVIDRKGVAFDGAPPFPAERSGDGAGSGSEFHGP